MYRELLFQKPVNMSVNNWLKPFRVTAGLILAITGLAKVAAVTAGHAKLLDAADPITGLHFRHLMLGAGGLELVVASVCLCAKRQTLAPTCIAWLATVLFVYRLGLWGAGWHLPCSCLGNFTDAIHVPPMVADNVMKGVLAYLLVGSYVAVLHLWWKNTRPAFVSPKLAAQNCGM